MDYTTALSILGSLFGCWAAGYAVSFIITFVKKLGEKL